MRNGTNKVKGKVIPYCARKRTRFRRHDIAAGDTDFDEDPSSDVIENQGTEYEH